MELGNLINTIAEIDNLSFKTLLVYLAKLYTNDENIENILKSEEGLLIKHKEEEYVINIKDGFFCITILNSSVDELIGEMITFKCSGVNDIITTVIDEDILELEGNENIKEKRKKIIELIITPLLIELISKIKDKKQIDIFIQTLSNNLFENILKNNFKIIKDANFDILIIIWDKLIGNFLKNENLTIETTIEKHYNKSKQQFIDCLKKIYEKLFNIIFIDDEVNYHNYKQLYDICDKLTVFLGKDKNIIIENILKTKNLTIKNALSAIIYIKDNDIFLFIIKNIQENQKITYKDKICFYRHILFNTILINNVNNNTVSYIFNQNIKEINNWFRILAFIHRDKINEKDLNKFYEKPFIRIMNDDFLSRENKQDTLSEESKILNSPSLFNSNGEIEQNIFNVIENSDSSLFGFLLGKKLNNEINNIKDINEEYYKNIYLNFFETFLEKTDKMYMPFIPICDKFKNEDECKIMNRIQNLLFKYMFYIKNSEYIKYKQNISFKTNEDCINENNYLFNHLIKNIIIPYKNGRYINLLTNLTDKEVNCYKIDSKKRKIYADLAYKMSIKVLKNLIQSPLIYDENLLYLLYHDNPIVRDDIEMLDLMSKNSQCSKETKLAIQNILKEKGIEFEEISESLYEKRNLFY